jgi:hypothetical protein
MPPVTVSDSVEHYVFEPPTGAVGEALHRLLLSLVALDPEHESRDGLLDDWGQFAADASTDGFDYEVTTQPMDYFGHPCPYDCDALLEFLTAERPAGGDEANPTARWLLPDQLEDYRVLLWRFLDQPDLFPHQRSRIQHTIARLSLVGDASLLVVYRTTSPAGAVRTRFCFAAKSLK